MQRNELLSKNQYWLRKRFGRLIFTNFFVNYFQAEDIEKRTEELFQKEIELIKNYLPKKAENIMDIGCGLGIINIFLNKIYNNQPNFFLLDKNRIDKVIKYGFSSDYESYNDLMETRNLLINNDISSNSINTIDIEKDFSEALKGIYMLPNNSKFGVYAAYKYYKRLLIKLKRSSYLKIKKQRIRVPNYQKVDVLARSYVRYRLNIL